jgi:4-hydroxy-4-methyl-2-oxoglutarate aldolase
VFDDRLANRLAKLDSCSVSDANDLLGIKGAVIGIHAAWPCGKISGRVVTIKLASKGSRQPARHLGTAAIEAASPGNVIVVDHRGRCDVAGWGGLLSLAAKKRGVDGVIIDGACRDVDDSREVGFPVYARATVPVTARGRIVEHSFNEVVDVRGISVQPNDLVIADGSGVVFIPAARAEEVVAQAETLAAREAEMAKAVAAGHSVAEVMGGNYESMLERS